MRCEELSVSTGVFTVSTRNRKLRMGIRICSGWTCIVDCMVGRCPANWHITMLKHVIDDGAGCGGV